MSAAVRFRSVRGSSLLLLACGAIGAWAATPTGGSAQEMGDLSRGAAASAKVQGASYVTFVAEPATVAAGRRAVLEVRLRVREGFHVNSHQPKSDLLIPTAAVLEPGDAGVTVAAIEYPAGESYSFASNPGDKLDVYTGAVVLRVPVTARAGEHMLKGSLRYQACDQRACYPPKTLALAVPFTAR